MFSRNLIRLLHQLALVQSSLFTVMKFTSLKKNFSCDTDPINVVKSKGQYEENDTWIATDLSFYRPIEQTVIRHTNARR